MDDDAGDVTDLDWVRRRIVELDDARRELPRDDLAGRDRLHRISDDLRSILRAGNAELVHTLRIGWARRAGRKGGHEIDPAALEGWVASMMPSQGR